VVAGRIAGVFSDSTAGLGSAVDAATRAGADELYFFCETNSAVTARRAAAFRLPVSVIDPGGDFDVLEPAPPPALVPMPAMLEPAAARMRSAGLETEWEHGALTGEWLGLEVARAAMTADGPVFEVGVGRHDRAANAEIYRDGPPDAFLDQAVATVRELRRPDAPPHPANQLAPERWLRAVARHHPELASPQLAGLGALVDAPPPTEREDLGQRAVAPATAAGPTVVVFSVGVDPDVVPAAADARGALAPGAGLVIVLPEGDDHPLTRRLAASLEQPADVRTVPPGWREAPS
jgi:hypothetical protein